MQATMDFLKKYAVYAVVLAAIVFHGGMALGAWDLESTTWKAVDGVLVFLGFASIRGALSALFAGIDLGPVGLWITGKKTYILAVFGIAMNLVSFIWPQILPPDGSLWQLLNEILAFLGVGTVARAFQIYGKEAVKNGATAVEIMTKPAVPATPAGK